MSPLRHRKDELNTQSRLPELRELMKRNLVSGPGTRGSLVEFESENGPTISRGLMKTEEVAVAYTKMGPSVVFPKHQHHGTEGIMIIRGSLVVAEYPPGKEGVRTVFSSGEILRFGPEEPHEITSGANGAVLIAVTVPSDKGYPDG